MILVLLALDTDNTCRLHKATRVANANTDGPRNMPRVGVRSLPSIPGVSNLPLLLLCYLKRSHHANTPVEKTSDVLCRYSNVVHGSVSPS